eukprot:TRINITY_DN1633_c0_g1_i1.p1 TRINITY_DN1633_c0_g1~~TRINITY_DN1633_c0_g1_i1.p1  ORF type:complete len:465 (+),score=102.74 TRINITY_DN1633_c0_g1_i1:49-1443(+)
MLRVATLPTLQKSTSSQLHSQRSVLISRSQTSISTQTRSYAYYDAQIKKRKEREAALAAQQDQSLTTPESNLPEEPKPVVDPNALAPASEASSHEVLEHPALIVTRAMEWGSILVGFEQANKYTLTNQNGTVVGLMAEESGALGVISRQILRTHRGFTATIMNNAGQIVFKVKRPPYVISSSLYVEGPDEKVWGEVQMEWAPLRRKYNLIEGGVPFAKIDGEFLAWNFIMRDGRGREMGSVNKDFRGFGMEIFTDANQYVVRFGSPVPLDGLVTDEIPRHDLQSQTATSNTNQDPTLNASTQPIESDGQTQSHPLAEFTHKDLTIPQRALVLAAAVSIDFDYFSRSSGGGFGGMFPFMFPMHPPIPPTAGGEPGSAVNPEDLTGMDGTDGSSGDGSSGSDAPTDGTGGSDGTGGDGFGDGGSGGDGGGGDGGVGGDDYWTSGDGDDEGGIAGAAKSALSWLTDE